MKPNYFLRFGRSASVFARLLASARSAMARTAARSGETGFVRGGSSCAAGTLSAYSRRRRIASEREPSACAIAQLSIDRISSGGIRVETCGSFPVAGRPRPRFLGVTLIDFPMIKGHTLKASRGEAETSRPALTRNVETRTHVTG
jgi:hypothetical protein